MVKRSELEANIKEKVLLEGDSGTGKTYTAVKIAEFVASKGLDVVLVDPVHGSERELELLSDDVLDKIDLKTVLEWKDLVKAVKNPDTCFLKIVDGLSGVFEANMRFLVDRFVLRGKYQIGDKEMKITDKETFMLPWGSYPKVYDAVRSCVHSLLKQKPHIICTMHNFGDDGARARLNEDIYRKFDTVLGTRKVIGEEKGIVYDAILKKHRGRPMSAYYVMGDHLEQLKNLFGRRVKSGKNGKVSE